MLHSAAFLDELCGDQKVVKPSLAYAQAASTAGVHIMDVPAGVFNRVQVLVGLVAAGACIGVVISSASDKAPPVIGHPFVPVLHVVVDDLPRDSAISGGASSSDSADLVLHGQAGEAATARNVRWLKEIVSLISGAASREFTPK